MSTKLASNGVKFALDAFLKDTDFEKFFQLADHIGDDGDKLKSFIANPEAYAFSEVGFKVPDGFHMHFVNEKNEYFPPEGNAAEQIASYSDSEDRWSRIEIRAGKGPKCLVACGYCPSK